MSRRASLQEGKTPLDDLFGPSEEGEAEREQPPAEQAQPASDTPATTQTVPPEDPGELSQTTLLAYDYQLRWLAQKCGVEARGKVSKAELLRRLIDVAIRADVDLSDVRPEDLLESLEAQLRRE